VKCVAYGLPNLGGLVVDTHTSRYPAPVPESEKFTGSLSVR
jgi:hypothetical protein